MIEDFIEHSISSYNSDLVSVVKYLTWRLCSVTCRSIVFRFKMKLCFNFTPFCFTSPRLFSNCHFELFFAVAWKFELSVCYFHRPDLSICRWAILHCSPLFSTVANPEFNCGLKFYLDVCTFTIWIIAADEEFNKSPATSTGLSENLERFFLKIKSYCSICLRNLGPFPWNELSLK